MISWTCVTIGVIGHRGYRKGRVTTRKRIRTTVLVLTGVLATGLAGCGSAAKTSSSSTSKPLVKVNGQTITESQWQAAVATTDILQGTNLPTNSSAKKQQLTILAQQVVVNQWALAHHVITAKKASEEAGAYISQNITQTLGGTKGLDAALSQHHLSEAAMKEFLTQEMVLRAAYDKETASVTSLPKGTASKFYSQHTSLFATPAQAKVRMILVKSQTQADQLLAEIQHGASFSALAKKYSLDPSGKQGGSLGWVDLGPQSNFVPHFYEEMDKLKPGQYGIAHTRYGYHIIEVQALKAASTQPYASVKSQIVQTLLQQQKSQVFQTFINGLMKHARVKYLS